LHRWEVGGGVCGWSGGGGGEVMQYVSVRSGGAESVCDSGKATQCTVQNMNCVLGMLHLGFAVSTDACGCV